MRRSLKKNTKLEESLLSAPKMKVGEVILKNNFIALPSVMHEMPDCCAFTSQTSQILVLEFWCSPHYFVMRPGTKELFFSFLDSIFNRLRSY